MLEDIRLGLTTVNSVEDLVVVNGSYKPSISPKSPQAVEVIEVVNATLPHNKGRASVFSRYISQLSLAVREVDYIIDQDWFTETQLTSL